ncbi:MAG: 4Fe-4S binding protein [Deltaproteobacteria bacterium]|nr:4Fe-4S binding protein [Deltaproteobacteria bacterium]
MRAHYGYTDGSGEYYITIDTDRCDGCGECLAACPKDVFELAEDDYEELKAVVRSELARTLGDVCLGYHARCAREPTSCHAACPHDAIAHSW